MPATVHRLPLAAPSPAITNVSAQMGSSFGLDMTTLGPEFDANYLYNSERVRELQYRDSFFTATNHDFKLFDMNGRMIRPGKLSNQPLLSGAVPQVYVPLDQRRPSVPTRIARKIVSAFTAMTFGYGRFPQFRSDDPDTQAWMQALSDVCALEMNFIRARNLGGRTGTSGISWAFVEGEPRVTVHKGQHIHVLEWEDEDQQIPAHVVELYQVPGKGTAKSPWVWRRRDWTQTADVVFEDEPITKKSPELWRINQKATYEHNDGVCHFIWINNLPDDDDENGCDGACDYAVAYEQLSSLDMLNSVNTHGGIKNLDPTLVLRMDRDDVQAAVVQKGSDNAIVTGQSGDAKYMELSGSSIQAGTALVENNKNQILEVTECVVPDPQSLAAAGTSAVALKMIYAPMLGKCDVLRYQYGRALTRLLIQMTEYARKLYPDYTQPEGSVYPLAPALDDDGNPKLDPETGDPIEEPVEFRLKLRPKVVTKDVLDENGKPTGEVTTSSEEYHPGRGRLWLEWGPYFKSTADDDQKEAAALSAATGGKPVMSQQTAVELHANVHDRDGQEEWRRLQREEATAAKNAATANSGMFPPIGGGSGEDNLDA